MKNNNYQALKWQQKQDSKNNQFIAHHSTNRQRRRELLGYSRSIADQILNTEEIKDWYDLLSVDDKISFYNDWATNLVWKTNGSDPDEKQFVKKSMENFKPDKKIIRDKKFSQLGI